MVGTGTGDILLIIIFPALLLLVYRVFEDPAEYFQGFFRRRNPEGRASFHPWRYIGLGPTYNTTIDIVHLIFFLREIPGIGIKLATDLDFPGSVTKNLSII